MRTIYILTTFDKRFFGAYGTSESAIRAQSDYKRKTGFLPIMNFVDIYFEEQQRENPIIIDNLRIDATIKNSPICQCGHSKYNHVICSESCDKCTCAKYRQQEQERASNRPIGLVEEWHVDATVRRIS